MDDALLAWRNVWRNPRRSVLTMLAVVFAAALLVFMLSFQFGAYEDMINASVRLNTGHLQVLAPGYNDKPEIRRVLANPGPILERVRRSSGVAGASARSEAFVLAAGPTRTRGAMVIGVDPAAEGAVSTLPEQIRSGRYLKTGDTGAAVVGALLAKRLRVAVGGDITLLGQGRDGSVAATVARVVGIYRTGIDELDRTTLQITLSDFDAVFSMRGAVHRVVITATDLAAARTLERTLRAAKLPGSPDVLGWEDLMPGLKQSIELDLVSGLIMYLILIVVVAFSILNTFFMAIFERTREFGVMMAIGTRPGRLVKLMLMESMAMTLVGIVSGMALGAALTVFFSHYGIGLGESADLLTQYGISNRLYPRLSWVSLVTGPGIVLIITAVTALIPALKIPRLKPVAAMRAV